MNKKRITAGIAFFVLGLLIAAGPHTFLYVCKVGPDMVMRCHYTAQVETALGIEIALLGAALALSRSKGAGLISGISLGISALTAFLVPTYLIGVCDAVHMHCNSVTKPALALLSSLVFILSVVSIIAFGLTREKEDVRDSFDNRKTGNRKLKEETA